MLDFTSRKSPSPHKQKIALSSPRRGRTRSRSTGRSGLAGSPGSPGVSCPGVSRCAGRLHTGQQASRAENACSCRSLTQPEPRTSTFSELILLFSSQISSWSYINSWEGGKKNKKTKKQKNKKKPKKQPKKTLKQQQQKNPKQIQQQQKQDRK